MRLALKNRVGIRERYTATVQKFGTRPGSNGQSQLTICFEKVTDDLGESVAEHIWMVYSDPFRALQLQPGDVVSFEARVQKYRKGYAGWRDGELRSFGVDYQLINPSAVRLEKRFS